MHVRDLLNLDLLQEAGLTVLAGEEHLDAKVEWVHTGEIADIGQFLSGGEALLTAATGIGHSPTEMERYVNELAEAHACCLILELGRNFRRIPQEMVDAAARTDLVLATLDEEVPFARVTRRAHAELVNYAHAALERAILIDEALGTLILEGGSLTAVLELLAERLNNPVVLEDGAHRVVSFGRGAGRIAPILRSWRDHSRHGHNLDPDSSAVVNLSTGEGRCMWSAIHVRGENRGRLHILEVDSPLDDVARLALTRASSSIALFLMAERDKELSGAAETSLLGGLTAEGDFSPQEFISRAAGLGVELDGDLVMVVAGPAEEGADGEATVSTEVTDRQVAALRGALRKLKWPSLVGAIGGVPAAALTAPAEGEESRFEELAARLEGGALDGAHLGVSRKYRPSQLPQALPEAEAAYLLGPRLGRESIHYFEDLVLLRLLAPLSNGPTLANFAEAELAPLIQYDDEHNSELLRTLDAYLRCNGNKVTTGEMLHLQRRSVYYRLNRIEELLDTSLDDPDLRVRLYLALRSHEMLAAGVARLAG
ncbi:MAG: PucR family transcriptional regulator ligand-binding domain-containing protein [Actinobacteria bacterium]|nr:PucR family transcriptional regulator ligand-binding domain-containing protein [Actinomycetota bacterium]